MSDFKPHYHQRPAPGRPATNQAASFAWSVAALLLILAAYGLASSWDAHAQAEDQVISAQLQFAAERAEAAQAEASRVAEAYAQGQRDAMRNISEPEGVALAQACAAWRLRDLPAHFSSRKKGV
jgi:hypothetical protein